MMKFQQNYYRPWGLFLVGHTVSSDTSITENKNYRSLTFNHARFVKDLRSFFRSIQWKNHFASNSTNHTHTNTNIEPCLTQFTPSSQDLPTLPPHHPLLTFQNFITSNLASPSFPKSLKMNTNITPTERNPIHYLKTDPDLMIPSADKGTKAPPLWF